MKFSELQCKSINKIIYYDMSKVQCTIVTKNLEDLSLENILQNSISLKDKIQLAYKIAVGI